MKGVQVFDNVERPIFCHPTPMFEAHAPWNVAAELMNTLTIHGEGLSILIHPNTSLGVVADHTTHARWVGPSLAPQVEQFFSSNPSWL